MTAAATAPAEAATAPVACHDQATCDSCRAFSAIAAAVTRWRELAREHGPRTLPARNAFARLEAAFEEWDRAERCPDDADRNAVDVLAADR